MLLVSKYALVLVLLVCSATLHAQQNNNPAADSIAQLNPRSTEPFIVRSIEVNGNKRTKRYLIVRELPFAEGDAMPLNELVQKFELGRQQVMNTTLFNEVNVTLKSFEGHYVDVRVEVKERWYIFPIPYFKLVDRNLNVWLKEQNRSLDRVNYGLKFTHYNFSGRRDRLRLFLISGYTQEVSFSYSQPYADPKLRHGFSVGAGFSQGREIIYATSASESKPLFYKNPDNKMIRRQFRADIGYSYRPGLYFQHSARIAYADERIMDTALISRNPEYFGNGRSRYRFIDLSYGYDYFKTDYNRYPLKGVLGGVSLSWRNGLSGAPGMLSLNARGTKYWSLGKKYYFSLGASLLLKTPSKLSYYNNGLLGYGEYLRGLEYYVIDGSAGGILRTTFRKHILSFNIPTFIKSKSHDKIPFKIYLKTYGDAGFGYSARPPSNLLNNKLLYSGGVGIDVLTFYDFVLRFEYSFNQLGQKGLFLHTRDQ
jgi:outer membrane protein assembly factor BamA